MTEQEEKMWAEDIEMISKLNTENDELLQRIGKAIDYIFMHELVEEKEYVLNGKDLLEILKGGNNE